MKTIKNKDYDMTYREEQLLLETTNENNKMLKNIIRYINHISSKAGQENMDDFGRNVLANLLSEKLNRNEKDR